NAVQAARPAGRNVSFIRLTGCAGVELCNRRGLWSDRRSGDFIENGSGDTMRRGVTKISVHKRSFALSCLFMISVIASWILFVGGARRDEMLVGLGVVFLTSAFVYQVWRIETLHIAFHM